MKWTVGKAASANTRWPPPRALRAPDNTPTLRFGASATWNVSGHAPAHLYFMDTGAPLVKNDDLELALHTMFGCVPSD